LVLLAAGAIGTVWGFVRAHEAAANEAAQQEVAQVEKKRARQFAAFVSRLFRSADEFGFRGPGFRKEQERAKDLTVVELVKRAAQSVGVEFVDYPTTKADLLTMLGEVDRSQGQYEEAEKLLAEAQGLYRAEPNPDDLKVGENLYALASVLGDKWDYERSIPLFKEALQHLAGDSTPEGLRTRIQVKVHLGFALLGQSKDAKGEEVFREAIADCQGREKELSFELSMAQTGLVSALLAQGKDAKAQEQIVEHLVAQNPNVISQGIVAYRQITAHLSAHRFTAALEKTQELLKLAEREFGADHPVYALVLGVMADVQKKMGDYRGAEASIRKSLEIGGKWVVDHPKLWEPMQEFAKFLQGRGDFDEARKFYLKSLHIVTKRFGPSDPRFIGPAIGLHALLGRLARDRGDYPGAETEFAAALDLIAARMPQDPGMVAARAELLRDDGTAQMESGHLETALGRLQQSSNLYRSAKRPDDSLELESMSIELQRLLGNYAAANQEWKSLRAELDAQCRQFREHPERADWKAYQAFLKLKEFPLAAQTMAAYVDGVRHNPNADPMEPPDRLSRQGGLLVRIHEYGKASPVLREALALFERALGRDHSQCGDVMLELARADAGSGAKDMAESLAREACNVRETRLGREHLWTAKARAELAGILALGGKHKEAASILAGTLKFRIARLPAAHPDIWRNQLDLADSLEASNDHRAAGLMLRHSLQVLAGVLPPKSYRVAALESALAESLTNLGEFAEAERLLLNAYARQIEDVSHFVEGRQASRRRLAKLYQAWGKPSEAMKYTR
jgi:tetratricopeptide (TPR) repeat protein